MLLSSAQKVTHYAQYYAHHHCNYATVHIQFYYHIRIVRLLPVVFYITTLCCSAWIFYTLCSILCSWENLYLILHQVHMRTISEIKIIIYKSGDQHVKNWLIMTFNRLHWSFCYNFHSWAKPFLELCLMLSTTYYAQNYADMIGLDLLINLHPKENVSVGLA